MNSSHSTLLFSTKPGETPRTRCGRYGWVLALLALTVALTGCKAILEDLIEDGKITGTVVYPQYSKGNIVVGGLVDNVGVLGPEILPGASSVEYTLKNKMGILGEVKVFAYNDVNGDQKHQPDTEASGRAITSGGPGVRNAGSLRLCLNDKTEDTISIDTCMSVGANTTDLATDGVAVDGTLAPDASGEVLSNNYLLTTKVDETYSLTLVNTSEGQVNMTVFSSGDAVAQNTGGEAEVVALTVQPNETDAITFKAGQETYWVAVYTGYSTNKLTYSISAEVGPGFVLSRDAAAPSTLAVGTASTFYLPGSNGSNQGYLTWPTTTGKAYGLYISDLTQPVSYGVSYDDGGLTWTSLVFGSSGSATSGAIGFAASVTNATYYADVVASNGGTNLTVTVQEALLGGAAHDSSQEVTPGTATWVGAAPSDSWFTFTTGSTGGAATLAFANLSETVEVHLHDNAGTPISAATTTCSATSTCSFTTTALTASTPYKVKVIGESTLLNVHSIGQLTITAP